MISAAKFILELTKYLRKCLSTNRTIENYTFTKVFQVAEYIPQVYRGRFGRKHRFHRVSYFQLFVVVTTVPTEE